MDLRTAADENGVAVCLLNDDPSVLKATSRLLSSSGRKVESFMDPIAFLCYAQRHRPEVAVIDVSMPVVNGLQVQAHLRNLSPTTRVRCYLVSCDIPNRMQFRTLMATQGFAPAHRML
jgi:two-component system, NtrC family, C4-dicarboxylate transport response regulator DctD